MPTITIAEAPALYLTSKEPIVYKLNTTGVTKVICKIYDSASVLITQISKDPTFADPDKFEIQIDGIIDDLIKSDSLQDAALPFQLAPKSSKKFKCKFFNELDVEYNSADVFHIAISAIFKPKTLSQNKIPKFLFTGTAGQTLTNFPSPVRRVLLTDSFYEMFFWNAVSSNETIGYQVKRYNSNGGIIGITNPFFNYSISPANPTINIGVAPLNVNAAVDFNIGGNINTSVAFYTLSFYKKQEDVINYLFTRTYYIGKNCKSIRIHYRNRLNGFDSFLFTGQRIEQTESSSQSFENNLTEEKINIRSEEFTKVYSDFLSVAEGEALIELIVSPEVYLEIGTNDFIKIIIDTKKLQPYDSEKGLNKYEIDFHLAEKTQTQRTN